MNTGAIASRYASAFFEIVSESSDIENIYTSAKKLSNILLKWPVLRRVLSDRQTDLHDKINLLLRFVPSGVPDQIIQLLELLIRKNRSEQIIPVLLMFRKKYLSSRNILDVEIEFAHMPEDNILNELKRKIETTLKSSCEFEIVENPELIAGYILLVNGRIFDTSIKGQLRTVKRQLLDVKFENR